jgi:hypothetical protein
MLFGCRVLKRGCPTNMSMSNTKVDVYLFWCRISKSGCPTTMRMSNTKVDVYYALWMSSFKQRGRRSEEGGLRLPDNRQPSPSPSRCRRIGHQSLGRECERERMTGRVWTGCWFGCLSSKVATKVDVYAKMKHSIFSLLKNCSIWANSVAVTAGGCAPLLI